MQEQKFSCWAATLPRSRSTEMAYSPVGKSQAGWTGRVVRTLCDRGRILGGPWGTVSQKAARCNARAAFCFWRRVRECPPGSQAWPRPRQNPCRGRPCRPWPRNRISAAGRIRSGGFQTYRYRLRPATTAFIVMSFYNAIRLIREVTGPRLEIQRLFCGVSRDFMVLADIGSVLCPLMVRLSTRSPVMQADR